MKRSGITLLLALLILAIALFVVGKRKADAPAGNEKATSNQSALQQDLADVPLLTPVPAAEFGDIQLVTSRPDTLIIQIPDGASKIAEQANADLYQGVVYKTADDFFRVLFGKLSDASRGKLTLTDSFELVVGTSPDGATGVSLRQTDPATMELDSNKVVRWSNLPNNHQVIQTLLQYKQNQ